LGRSSLRILIKILPASTQIISLSRDPTPGMFGSRVQTVAADLRNFAAYKDLLSHSEYVIWMAANRSHQASFSELYQVNVEPLKSAVAVLRKSKRLRRFVYVSSVSAVDQATSQFIRVNDDSPVSPQTAYGHSKLIAETAVLSSGIPVTVLRLAFLYGPGYSATSFLEWYRRVALHPVLRRIRFTADLSLLYTSDFGYIVAEVIRENNIDSAELSPYVVSDGMIYDVDELITKITEMFGHKRPQVRTPVAFANFANNALAYGKYRYWRHAAFSKNFFTVDPARFQSHFPNIHYTTISEGLHNTYGIQSLGG
jgi:nucleoside-diphosphate-sugar epimerase